MKAHYNLELKQIILAAFALAISLSFFTITELVYAKDKFIEITGKRYELSFDEVPEEIQKDFIIDGKAPKTLLVTEEGYIGIPDVGAYRYYAEYVDKKITDEMIEKLEQKLSVNGYEFEVHRLNKRYDTYEEFHEGVAEVSIDGKYGYIDENGNEIIPLDFDENTKGVSVYTSPDRCSSSGEVAKNAQNGFVIVCRDDKYGYISVDGKIKVDPIYDHVEAFVNGYGRVKINDRYGYINKEGRLITEIKYYRANEFSEGRAAVQVYDEENDDYRYGYIDETGAEVIPLKYLGAGYFQEGLASVTMPNGECFYIDKNGNRAIDVVDSSGRVFVNGAVKVNVDDGVRFINREGKFITPKYRSMGEYYSDGVVPVKVTDEGDENQRYGYLDKNGKLVISNKYYGTFEFSEGVGITLRLDENGSRMYGCVNRDGVDIIPNMYDFVSDCENGFLKVAIGPILKSDYGLYDKNGNIVLEPVFSTIQQTNENGLIEITRNDIFGNHFEIFDMSGKYVIKGDYFEDYRWNLDEDIFMAKLKGSHSPILIKLVKIPIYDENTINKSTEEELALDVELKNLLDGDADDFVDILDLCLQDKAFSRSQIVEMNCVFAEEFVDSIKSENTETIVDLNYKMFNNVDGCNYLFEVVDGGKVKVQRICIKESFGLLPVDGYKIHDVFDYKDDYELIQGEQYGLVVYGKEMNAGYTINFYIDKDDIIQKIVCKKPIGMTIVD